MYCYIMGGNGKPIESLGDLFASQAFHYIDNNGRFANFLAQLFCGITGKVVFNVLNALVMMLFIHLCSKLIAGRRSALAAAMTAFFVLFIFPFPGDTILWLTGSVNYLWAITLSLAFIYFIINNASKPQPAWRHVVVFFFALIAGDMNESVTLGVALGLALYFAFNRSKLHGIAITATVGYFIGLLIIMCSPGAWQRLSGGGDINMNMGIAQMLSRRVINLLFKTAHYITPTLAFLVIVISLFKKGWKHTKANLINWAFVGTVVAMFAFAVLPERVYTGFAVLGFLVVAQAVFRLLEGRTSLMFWATALLLLASLYPAAKAMKNVIGYRTFNDNVEQAIAQAPRQCILPVYEFPRSRWVSPSYYDSHRYSSYVEYYNLYYDKDNVVFLRDSLYDRVNSDNLLRGSKLLDFSSSNSEVIDTVYAFPGNYFALVPMDRKNIKIEFDLVTMKVHNIEERYDADELANKKLWGTLKQVEQGYIYYIEWHGRYFLVLPEIQDDVLSVDVPVLIDGKNATVTLTRNNNAKP
ncbi:MAG: hypothetical protein IK092_04575 [Muribaculaceae bacterium]|nr:hypothetical protein [Muribaculaceae bacterium]